MDENEIRLGRREHLALADDVVAVRVRAGEVWITRDRDSSDTVLREGDVLNLQGERGALLGALSPARLVLRRRPLPGRHATATVLARLCGR